MNVQAKRTTEVIITLSEYEALFLQTLMRCVGGPPLGPREVANTLYESLCDLDLNYAVFPHIPEGAVYFT